MKIIVKNNRRCCATYKKEKKKKRKAFIETIFPVKEVRDTYFT